MHLNIRTFLQLEISLSYGQSQQRVVRSIAILLADTSLEALRRAQMCRLHVCPEPLYSAEAR